MSTGESFESRFEKIDVTLKDPKSEVNVDCLLVSRERRWAPRSRLPEFLTLWDRISHSGLSHHPASLRTSVLFIQREG